MPKTQQDGGKVFECSRSVVIRPGESGGKSRFDGPLLLLHPPDNPEKDRQIAAGVESMVEPAQATNIPAWIEISDRF